MPHQPPETTATTRRLTAFLAEPDPAARAVLADILERRFAVVVQAASLVEAREKITACQPDLAIVAARLPDGQTGEFQLRRRSLLAVWRSAYFSWPVATASEVDPAIATGDADQQSPPPPGQAGPGDVGVPQSLPGLL